MKILLVDNSRLIRILQKNILATRGHTDIVEAANGIEALKSIEEGDPDLMLLEWNMPNMNGYTLLKRIREMGKKFPVIMCTTESEKSHVIQAIRAGANNYVIKPFSAETLIEKIDWTMKNVKTARPEERR